MADDRTYIKLHDGMPGHPKVRGLSDKAFRTLIRSWCYCSEYLTDGEIVTAVARDFGTKKTWDELVAANLAESAPGGFLMHDYLEHQRSASEVAEIKAAKGSGGTLGNHIRWHVKPRKPSADCEFCIANGSHDRSDMRSDNRSQNDRSPIAPRSQNDRTPIAETETETEEKNSSRGGSHVSSGPPPKPPLYSDRCTRHGDVAEPGNCGGCADARKANATRPLALVRDTKRCLVHDETFTTVCRGCRADEIAAKEETA